MSGGLDSTTLAYYIKSAGYNINGLSFNYGQKAIKELEVVKEITKRLKLKELKVVNIDLAATCGSALTSDIDVPKVINQNNFFPSENIPITYVPARNIIFLSIALAYAETIDAQKIFYGANCIDYSGYPDCRPAFIEAFNKLSEVGTKAGVNGKAIKIEAPFLYYSKEDIVKLALKLNVPIDITWSCYENNDKPCGRCESCLIRQRAIEEAIKEVDNY
ncbi:MAG: 7-cyano-7-deazaguanine synthase QueC [Deferribacterota bacterium]|nr:7-cyano-7-deazaguanine synthase QueC [Deferribacterota bacterium]